MFMIRSIVVTSEGAGTSFVPKSKADSSEINVQSFSRVDFLLRYLKSLRPLVYGLRDLILFKVMPCICCRTLRKKY